MDKKVKKSTKGNTKLAEKTPRSLGLSAKGIRTGNDFANFMSAVMSDIIEGTITPAVGNAVCNAGGKLLKVVEMQLRYGTQINDKLGRVLILAGESETQMQSNVQ